MPEARILIVEDEAILAMDMQNRLSKLGYPLPDVVHSGEDAISKAMESPPGLILMDIRLPGKIDGIQAAAQIRDSLDVPIIFVTAFADEETLQRAKLTEPFGYIVKPVQERELLAVIEMSLYKHAAQAQLKKLNEELEQRVKERTAELQATNKELEAFAYSVSHDLRAPLRGMDGFSRILLEKYQDKLDETGKDYLNRIRAAAQRMGTLIDDILQLSRVTRSEIRRERVNLSALAKRIAADLQKTQPGRRVEFTIADGVTTDGDITLMEAVLENLMNNAWKFTDKHVRARIEFGVTRRDGKSAYFVRDDGAGFDMTYVNKLFVPFQRLHAIAEFPGNGIGLATVQRIVHRHGGEVWAEGEVEKGATFYFTIGETNKNPGRSLR